MRLTFTLRCLDVARRGEQTEASKEAPCSLPPVSERRATQPDASSANVCTQVTVHFLFIASLEGIFFPKAWQHGNSDQWRRQKTDQALRSLDLDRGGGQIESRAAE